MTGEGQTANGTVVRSVCGMCQIGCGILAHCRDGKVIKIEGDPESPSNKGALCPNGLASLEYLYHPDRLTYPVKRTGERGQGGWQRISWDEALDEIAGALVKAKQDYGAESIALIQGVAKGFQNTWLNRLGRVFGIPNIIGQGHVCTLPRVFAAALTCGFVPLPDFEHPPASITVWGCNPAATHFTANKHILDAIDGGSTKLMVVDPASTNLTKRADVWVRLRPGSDLALVLAMIKVIIDEELYDQDYVEKWTTGFDEIKAHVQDYSLEKAAEITWLGAGTIRNAARFYAGNKPGCIQQGNGIDHNINSFQTSRALMILRAITGNLGVPGGDIEVADLPLVRWNSPDALQLDKLPKSVWQRRLNTDLLPMFPEVPAPNVVKAILESDPYPVHVAYVQGCNPLVTYSNVQEAYEAFMKLDFLAVADMFMTPTAALADIVLPVTSYLEYDNVVAVHGTVAHIQQKVAQIGESRSDYEIMHGLSGRMGIGEHFWDNSEEALDYILQPSGLNFAKFREIGIIAGETQYRKHETDGFRTPSGKAEIYSDRLAKMGYDPLPVFLELPETPQDDPDLAAEYPLTFTSQKLASFIHSTGKQIGTLRANSPEPVTMLHPETAGQRGIADGDMIYIETKRGRIKQKAALNGDIDPRVIVADYGWWFPEKGASELYGWAEANINVLTDDQPPYGHEVGSTMLRGTACNVFKA